MSETGEQIVAAVAQTETDLSTDERLKKAFTTDALGVETFDVDAVVPRTRKLKLGGRDYAIAGEVPLTLLATLLRFEEELTKEDSVGEQIATMNRLNAEIRDHLCEMNDDVPEELGLSTQSLPFVTTYLMNGRSATEAALLSMTGGPLARLEQTLAEIRDAAAEAGEVEAEPEDVPVLPPLASAKPSSRRSSRSAKSTAGRRAGGKPKTSAPSAST